MGRLQCELLNKVVGVRRFKESITLLPVAIKPEHFQFIKKSLEDIKSVRSIEDLFWHLNLYWTYLEYSLLSHIIHSHSDIVSTDLEEAMKRYTEDIEAFKKDTTVGQIIEVGLGNIRGEPPPGFTRSTVKLNKNVSEYTLQELDEIRRKASKAFNLPEFILVLETVYQSSICIVWHIPSSEVYHFNSASLKVLQLISADLIYFEVGYSVVFPAYSGKSLYL